MSLDLDVLRLLAHHRVPVVTSMARWAMDIGTSRADIAVLAAVGLVVVVVKRWWWHGATIAVSALSAQAVARTLKQMIQRPRPPEDLAAVQVGAFSMPSTVAAMTAAAAIAAFLVLPWRVSRRWTAALLALLVGVIGIAMVYLGAHWPTDVLVGWCVGAGVGIAVVGLTRIAQRCQAQIRTTAGADRERNP